MSALLYNIADVQTGPFGTQLHKDEYIDKGIPVVTVEHLGRKKLTQQNLPYISSEKANRLEKYSLIHGDIVFSRVGSVDRCSYVSEEENGWLFSSRCLRIRSNTDTVFPLFLYYYLTQRSLAAYIRSIAVGATMPSINTKLLSEIPIILPPLPEQKAIADTLSCLDDKIESNNEVSQILEEMAFTMFEHLMTTKTGKTCILSEIAEINPTRKLSKKTVAKCIDMAKLSTSGCFPTGWDDKPFTGGTKFKNGDTLLARITPCLENGKTAFINFLEEEEIAFGSTEYIVIAPKEGFCSEFFYCLARYHDFVNYAVKNMNGTSGRQRVSGTIIGEYEIAIPDYDLLAEFSSVVPAFFDTIRANSLENQTLTEIRDTLLPKLMSGEVRVPLGEVE